MPRQTFIDNLILQGTHLGFERFGSNRRFHVWFVSCGMWRGANPLKHFVEYPDVTCGDRV